MKPSDFYGPFSSPHLAGRSCALCGEAIEMGEYVWESQKSSTKRPPYKHAVVCSRHADPRGATSATHRGRLTLSTRT